MSTVIPYLPVTVTRGPQATFTVIGTAARFTVTGHPGTTVDNGLLLESGTTFLLTETGDLILIA